MPKFKADIKDIGIKEVEGKFTKLKGYSKFKFFSYKIGKIWYIREFKTGRRLGDGNTEANAKKASKNYLKEYLHEQIQTRIDELDVINGENNETN